MLILNTYIFFLNNIKIALDDNKDKEKESKRRNSIIDSSMSIPNDEIIPHVFVPHSYIKPTKWYRNNIIINTFFFFFFFFFFF